MDKVQGAFCQFFYLHAIYLAYNSPAGGCPSHSTEFKSSQEIKGTLLLEPQKENPQTPSNDTFLGDSWLHYARRKISSVNMVRMLAENLTRKIFPSPKQ